ncbi:MAG: hypothetical protein LAP85_01825 [Acidobacteriia bacterium]|nr:hypothetical protein [Terriglobia bacterium]
MKPISFVMSGLLLMALASFGYSQSLADLAKKEQERRQAIKTAAKVITNEQAAKYQSAPITTITPATAPATDKPGAEKPAGEGAAKADVAPATEGAKPATEGAKPATDEPVDFQGRTESFWKQAFADARQKVKDLESECNVLILKRNDLQNRFYRESDGYKQQEIQRQIQKTIYEQDLNKENLAKAKDALTDLEKEARKSGALPGWIK